MSLKIGQKLTLVTLDYRFKETNRMEAIISKMYTITEKIFEERKIDVFEIDGMSGVKFNAKTLQEYWTFSTIQKSINYNCKT